MLGVSPQEARIDSRALGRQVHPLPSGFDLTTWKSARTDSDSQRDRDRRFRILYAGTYSGDRIELSGLVFRGLRRFVDLESGRPLITFTYLGPNGNWFMSTAAKHHCEDIAEDGGLVSPVQARLIMMRADLLVLLIPTTREGGMPSGKFYEYLAAGPPILAVHGTDPYVMRILGDAQAGEGASTPEDIAEVVARRYEDWRLGRVVPRPLDGLRSFTWSARAHQLAGLLDSLASPGSGDNDVMDATEGVIA